MREIRKGFRAKITLERTFKYSFHFSVGVCVCVCVCVCLNQGWGKDNSDQKKKKAREKQTLAVEHCVFRKQQVPPCNQEKVRNGTEKKNVCLSRSIFNTCKRLQYVKDIDSYFELKGWKDTSNGRELPRFSHYTHKETEVHSSPKFRERLGNKNRNQHHVPNFQGSVLTTLCCLVCPGWGTDPQDMHPKGFNISL